jgi:hypothetical protein
METTSKFVVPKKVIKSEADLVPFQQSKAFAIIQHYLQQLSDAVRSKPISWASKPENATQASAAVDKVMSMLDEIDSWTVEIEPVQQPTRYGNKAFRTWHARLVERADQLVIGHLGETMTAASVELAPYLHVSFGNETRIDYGTGHECAFFAFLCVLCETGFFDLPRDAPFIVLRIFVRYMKVMRRLQQRYMLEPAGSHGVWGLDDFHHLSYLFGASQLIRNDQGITPNDIHDVQVVQQTADEYLYMECIREIRRVKHAPFFEHSPMLNDISSVPNWDKIASGMQKMYRGEVLLKFPVIQHFLFGSVLSFDSADA